MRLERDSKLHHTEPSFYSERDEELLGVLSGEMTCSKVLTGHSGFCIESSCRGQG